MFPARIKYRSGRQSDLTEALRMILMTLNHLRKRSGLSPFRFRVTEPDPLMKHLFSTDPDGCYVAINPSGRVIGFALSQIREDEWYLGWLFVAPSYQSKKVGQQLLKRTLRYAADHNCRRRALATFGYNNQAVAVYSKCGMTPQRAILAMTRRFKKHSPPVSLKPQINLTFRQATDEREINRLSRLDKEARGIKRSEEHLFWLGDSEYFVYTFHDKRKLAGYGVFTRGGRIGPLVAASHPYLSSIMALTVNLSAQHSQKGQTIFVHGEKVEIVTQLLEAGFMIGEVDLLMASEKVADPEIYIPGHLAIY